MAQSKDKTPSLSAQTAKLLYSNSATIKPPEKDKKIISHLSGNADIFEADGTTLTAKAQEETAGLKEGTYDKYLKFVSSIMTFWPHGSHYTDRRKG